VPVAHPYFEEVLVDAALRRRWERAQVVRPEDIRLDMRTGRFWCQSKSTAELLGYNGFVKFDENDQLVEAWCGCKDFHNHDMPVKPKLHDVEVCYHILCAGKWWVVLASQMGMLRRRRV